MAKFKVKLNVIVTTVIEAKGQEEAERKAEVDANSIEDTSTLPEPYEVDNAEVLDVEPMP